MQHSKADYKESYDETNRSTVTAQTAPMSVPAPTDASGRTMPCQEATKRARI